MTPQPSPGVLNAFQQYQARKAAAIILKVCPEKRSFIPPISDATRNKIIQLLKQGERNVDVEKLAGVGHATISRIKRKLRDQGELK